MKILLRCAKCGHRTRLDPDKEVCFEIDFRAKKMFYICREEDCGHENILDFGTWKDGQGRSPLPPIGIF